MENGRYIVLLFKATEFEGTVVSSEEGEMEWISLDDLSAINVVEDFHDLMKVMNDPDLNEFQYTIENGEWIVHLK
jgi:8-oxo-dGTP diphosphatase